MDRQQDHWAQWLLKRRFGGDAASTGERAQFMERLLRVRDQILDRSALAPGETLLDVGCGDGLIGFGALARRAGTVIFSDVSADLIAVCRSAAVELGDLDRCRFLEAGAVDLAALSEQSVDVVTTRAVLIYVQAKQQAFDERDLVRHAEEAGFFPIELKLEAEIRPIEPRQWESFHNSAPNPKVPTVAEAMEQALTPEERERVVAHLRPLVEAGRGTWRMAHAHLYAVKPA